jgi:hypothetical protein
LATHGWKKQGVETNAEFASNGKGNGISHQPASRFFHIFVNF